MAIIHDGNSVPISSGNPLPTQLSGSDVQIPVDIQSRYATTIQTHAAVMIPPTSAIGGAWLDSNGFDTLGITVKNDANTSISVDVFWSNDGVATHGYEGKTSVGSYNTYVHNADTKARYYKVSLYNSDAAPHTMSAWAYLKA